MIVISRIALLAMIAGQAFCAAKAFGRLLMAMRGLAIALALLAQSAVDRIAPVAGATVFAIRTGRQIVARLCARLSIVARTVTVALAARTSREVPARARTDHLILRSAITARHALAQARLRAIVAPAAGGVIATL